MPKRSAKPRRVIIRATGEAGTVIKTINRCLWVQMDDGRELSGGADYWKPERKRKERSDA